MDKINTILIVITLYTLLKAKAFDKGTVLVDCSMSLTAYLLSRNEEEER